MNTPIEIRPVNIRLLIAYMADAHIGPFPKCEPGNTFTRAYEFINDGTHSQYHNMWYKISSFYSFKRLYEMSDSEIVDYFNNARANGIDPDGNGCTGMDIMRAKQRWSDNGWTRYEQKRNGRRSVAFKIVPAAILATMGITMPVES